MPQLQDLKIIRIMVVLACKQDWSMFNLDVKSTFFNGPLDEVVHVTQSPGFVIQGE